MKRKQVARPSAVSTFQGYRRTSFKFNESWKDDDKYEYLGMFKILKRVLCNTAESEAEKDHIYTVRAPRGASKRDVENVLQNTFTWHCRCEHDCCGHLFTGVRSMRRIKRREWSIEVARRYNV